MDRAVGIVPNGYFAYHASVLPVFTGASGYSTGFAPSVLVEDNFTATPAHEIGHTFGLYAFPGPEEYEAVAPRGNVLKGFDVPAGLPFENRVCFMGIIDDADQAWIDTDDYNNLFSKLRTGTDPELLLLTGTVKTDGSVRLGPWRQLPAGTATPNDGPSDYSVRLLDYEGALVAEVPVNLQFAAHVDPFGGLPTDEAPMMIAIPFSASVATIEIIRLGQVITRVEPYSKLLNDAVESVPSAAFLAAPDSRRKALQQKIAAIDRMLENGAFQGALGALQSLRSVVLTWLRRQPKSDLMEYSLDDLIALIDRSVARITTQSNR